MLKRTNCSARLDEPIRLPISTTGPTPPDCNRRNDLSREITAHCRKSTLRGLLLPLGDLPLCFKPELDIAADRPAGFFPELVRARPDPRPPHQSHSLCRSSSAKLRRRCTVVSSVIEAATLVASSSWCSIFSRSRSMGARLRLYGPPEQTCLGLKVPASPLEADFHQSSKMYTGRQRIVGTSSTSAKLKRCSRVRPPNLQS